MSSSLQDEYIKKESLYGAQNYSPLSVVLEKGDCAYLWDVDGNKYTTVKIGNQIWMSENLRTKHYQDGSEIDIVFLNNNLIHYHYQIYS